MDMLWYGLKVAVVGMLVVFLGLVILIACIRALKAMSKGTEAQQKAGDEPGGIDVPAMTPPPAPPAPEPVRHYTPGPPLTRKDGTFYAVISAAVGEVLAAEGVNPDGGFKIQSVKKIDELGRKLTLRDGALYAVITAAVAGTLESEGIHPDGGFAVRSVKAL